LSHFEKDDNFVAKELIICLIFFVFKILSNILKKIIFKK